MTELQKTAYERTNDYGKKYVKYLNIVGIETTASNARRQVLTAIFRHPDGTISTFILPENASKDDSCCCFGDLKYFAMYMAYEKSGITPKWLMNGNLIWPVWICDDKEKLSTWKAEYDRVIQRYAD